MSIIIETKRLILRSYQISDADDVRRISADFEIADTTCRIPHPYEDGMAKEWIKRILKNKDTELVFAITNKVDGNLLGSIELSKNKENNKAEIGYIIGKNYWGCGYATEAVKAMVDYGFTNCKLNKLTAWVFSRNPSSSKVLEKNGFTYEGQHKEHIFIRGNYEDLNSYGYLRADWLARYAK